MHCVGMRSVTITTSGAALSTLVVTPAEEEANARQYDEQESREENEHVDSHD